MNIHLIKTDKPSRLFYDKVENRLINKNIFITSDEEIKEGDYWLNRDDNKIYHSIFWQLANNAPSCKKIILTTDQDLIKDGVQAIGYEFLEWFVENPSCEYVDVNDWMDTNGNIAFGGNVRYQISFSTYNKIIIPKEEPKQETIEELSPMNDLLQDLKESKVSVKESIDIIEDEFIRETLNLYVQTTLDNVIARIENELLEKELKWQQKRMYSEADMREAYFTAIKSTGEGWNGEYANGNCPNIEKTFNAGFEIFIEQYKTK